MKQISCFLAFVIVPVSLPAEIPDEKKRREKWEEKIVAIEMRLQKSAPPKNAIFFAGSSTIVGWDLKKSFPDLPVVNVGFGGSEIRDSTIYADRILLKYKPKIIVFYAGDNDIASKRSAEQVLADFRTFVEKIGSELPDTKILFLSVKPSPKRIALIDIQKNANQLVQTYCKDKPQLQYIDCFEITLNREGKPQPELFKDDELHLNAEGYRVWSDRLRPFLK